MFGRSKFLKCFSLSRVLSSCFTFSQVLCVCTDLVYTHSLSLFFFSWENICHFYENDSPVTIQTCCVPKRIECSVAFWFDLCSERNAKNNQKQKQGNHKNTNTNSEPFLNKGYVFPKRRLFPQSEKRNPNQTFNRLFAKAKALWSQLQTRYVLTF